ncbi:SRPBCC domain-containing protein [Paenibacillus taihuensis]|uniref:SRPBCC domain-containing protein n=1 Tax=Paenibacillus taihuensis TaxID=1156355 RepID=UPI000E27D20C|nr:SRPBCC domain-containing protein [Paenibacillus taihuensis]
MRFRSKILKLVPPYEFSWLGKVGVQGIFDGEHIFELKPIDSNHTLFVHREVFTGIMVPFVSRMLDGDTKRGFMEMNVALKERVEHTGSPITSNLAMMG